MPVRRPKEVARYLIGVDPGINGGIAVICNKEIHRLIKMPPTPKDIYEELFTYHHNSQAICYLEQLHGLPGMSGTGMFKLGKNFGYLEMALVALRIPVVTVSPQKWQKEYGLGTKNSCQTNTVWKNKLKQKAQQLYPDAPIYLWGSDAVLIAEYGRRTYKT